MFTFDSWTYYRILLSVSAHISGTAQQMKVSGFSLDSRCPETRSHWRKLNRQRSEWETVRRGKGNRRGCLAEHTHGFCSYNQGRNVIIGAYAFPSSILYVCIFNPELGIIAPLARIPPQAPRISSSGCSTRERCFPTPHRDRHARQTVLLKDLGLE